MTHAGRSHSSNIESFHQVKRELCSAPLLEKEIGIFAQCVVAQFPLDLNAASRLVTLIHISFCWKRPQLTEVQGDPGSMIVNSKCRRS
jgi:hypothetical protein